MASSYPIQPQAFTPNNGSVATPIPENTPKLFTPTASRSIKFHNRIVVSPMCMYSSTDGLFNDYHVAHYGSLALRGPGAIILEASAVEPRGRISPHDAGIWSDDHIPSLKRIIDFIKSQGVVPGIQIAHAGRKANMNSPWNQYAETTKEEGGWPDNVVGPSSLPYDVKHATPRELTVTEMKEIIQKFVDAAVRADKAGVELLEIHSAHGYLLHSFASANSNKRTDEYGGSLENRLRFPLEIVEAVRAAWPDHKPLWVRVSATDFKHTDVLAEDKEGWDIKQTIEYVNALKKIGVDVIDVSAGGNIPLSSYPIGPLYQVPLSEAIKTNAPGIETAAVGGITEPKDAEMILQENKADYILLAREHLRNPAWTERAAAELGVDIPWANQYARSKKHI